MPWECLLRADFLGNKVRVITRCQSKLLRGTIMLAFWSWLWLFWVCGWSWEISIQTVNCEGWKRMIWSSSEVRDKELSAGCLVWEGPLIVKCAFPPSLSRAKTEELLRHAPRCCPLAGLHQGRDKLCKQPPLWAREAPAGTCVVS